MKIEGRNAVAELLKTSKTVDRILVENGLRDEASKNLVNLARAAGIKVQFADRNVVSKESESGKHQGFIAFVSDFVYSEIEDILKTAKNKFIVLLDGVEDPHNLGSIIRVCECGGVDGIVITKHRSASVSDVVMRISEGAANHMKIAKVTNLNNTIDKLKEEGYWIFGAETGGEDIYKTDLKGSIALVIGGEDSGINKLTRSKCDKIISLPMKGKVNSLNASVACGIAVYEAMRQRL